MLFVTLEIGKPSLLDLSRGGSVACLGFVRQLMDFHASGVNEAPRSLSLSVTSGAILTTESRVQLNLLLCSITLSTQTLHLFPFLIEQGQFLHLFLHVPLPASITYAFFQYLQCLVLH